MLLYFRNKKRALTIPRLRIIFLRCFSANWIIVSSGKFDCKSTSRFLASPSSPWRQAEASDNWIYIRFSSIAKISLAFPHEKLFRFSSRNRDATQRKKSGTMRSIDDVNRACGRTDVGEKAKKKIMWKTWARKICRGKISQEKNEREDARRLLIAMLCRR